MVREIPLTQGLVTVVDAADYDRVAAAGSWHTVRNGDLVYAGRKVPRPGGGQALLRLHTFLTGWAFVDHINLDGLDNRRANLRPATKRENNRNRRLQKNNTQGYKGVYIRSSGRWQAMIGVNGRRLSLGYHDHVEDAAQAYDAAAREHFGEFARLNFPQPREHAVLLAELVDPDED